MIRAIEAAPEGDPPALEVVGRAFSVLVDKGHARVVAWLLLSGHPVAVGTSRLRSVAEVAHRRRVEATGDPTLPFEDTLFRTLLVSLTIFGEAVAGSAMRGSAGMTDQKSTERFRTWLARLIAGPKVKV